MTRFDLDRLTAADIAGLSKQREGLYNLKEAVKPLLEGFPTAAGDRHRFERLKEAAETIVAEWTQKRASFSNFARSVFKAETFMSQDISNYISIGMSAGAAGAWLGSTSFTVLATGAGLAVGVIAGGVQAYQRLAQNPYRFLTKLESSGAKLVSSY
jgi:hypothetical protein